MYLAPARVSFTYKVARLELLWCPDSKLGLIHARPCALSTVSLVKINFPFDSSLHILSGHLVMYMTGVLLDALGSDKAAFYPRSASPHRMPTHLTVVLDILFEQLQLLLLLGQGLLLFL